MTCRIYESGNNYEINELFDKTEFIMDDLGIKPKNY